MKENVDLIKEINDLKRELKNLSDENKRKRLNPEGQAKKKNQSVLQSQLELDEQIEFNQETISNMKRQVEQMMLINKDLKDKRPASGKIINRKKKKGNKKKLNYLNKKSNN